MLWYSLANFGLNHHQIMPIWYIKNVSFSMLELRDDFLLCFFQVYHKITFCFNWEYLWVLLNFKSFKKIVFVEEIFRKTTMWHTKYVYSILQNCHNEFSFGEPNHCTRSLSFTFTTFPVATSSRNKIFNLALFHISFNRKVLNYFWAIERKVRNHLDRHKFIYCTDNMDMKNMSSKYCCLDKLWD